MTISALRRLAPQARTRCILALGITALYAAPTFADIRSSEPCTCDPDGLQPSGAVYRICMPPEGEWNGNLIVYAHGYVAINEPIAIPEDQLVTESGFDIPATVTSLGYALAVTSYSVNGLAVKEGIAEIFELVDIFIATYGQPEHMYIAGVSEGGLIATLVAERFPDAFDGAFCGCGPIGDFHAELAWFFDFRVAFDYFFPELLPGSVEYIPPSAIDTWDEYYHSIVLPTIFSRKNTEKLRQLVAVARVPYEPLNRRDTLERSLDDMLWYNVFATNDAVAKLGGLPSGNEDRWYLGAWNARRLNANIARHTASPEALAEIESAYQTSGNPQIPLVTLHAILDPQVPYWHMPLYRQKVEAQGAQVNYINVPSFSYGHCDFSQAEALVAIGLLVLRVEGPDQVARLALESLLPDGNSKREFRALAKGYGLPLASDSR